MNYQKSIFFLVTVLVFSANAASGQNLSGSVGVNTGLRSGRFQAAPKSESLWLQESAISGYSRSVASVADVEFKVGGSAGISQMRGDLGPGLTSLSGYRFTPVLHAEYSVASLSTSTRIFANLGYAYARYSGSGSDSWDSDQSSSLFLLGSGSIEEREKKYVSYGPQVSTGILYDLKSDFFVSGEIAVAFDTMVSNSPVYTGGKEIGNKGKSAFTSRSLMFGGGYSL